MPLFYHEDKGKMPVHYIGVESNVADWLFVSFHYDGNFLLYLVQWRKAIFFSRKFVPGNSDFKSAGIISSFLIIFSQILQYSSINKFLTWFQSILEISLLSETIYFLIRVNYLSCSPSINMSLPSFTPTAFFALQRRNFVRHSAELHSSKHLRWSLKF